MYMYIYILHADSTALTSAVAVIPIAAIGTIACIGITLIVFKNKSNSHKVKIKKKAENYQEDDSLTKGKIIVYIMYCFHLLTNFDLSSVISIINLNGLWGYCIYRRIHIYNYIILIIV